MKIKFHLYNFTHTFIFHTLKQLCKLSTNTESKDWQRSHWSSRYRIRYQNNEICVIDPTSASTKMSYSNWLNYLKSAEKSSIIQHGVRKLWYKFPDSHEMMEEYSIQTGMILKRAWKKKRDLLTCSPNDSLLSDGRFEWDYELGDFTKPLNNDTDFFVAESSTTVSSVHHSMHYLKPIFLTT